MVWSVSDRAITEYSVSGRSDVLEIVSSSVSVGLRLCGISSCPARHLTRVPGEVVTLDIEVCVLEGLTLLLIFW